MQHLFSLENPLVNFLAKIVDIFILNMLFIITSLPIITIGTASTALYSVTQKIVRGEDRYIVRDYFIAFKRNFKQSTILWLLLLMGGLLIFIDYHLFVRLSGIPKIFLASVLLTFCFVYLCISLFIFPYIARYVDTLRKAILNSLLLAISNFPYLLLLFVMNFVPLIFVFSSPIGFLTGLYVFTFGGFSFLAFLNSFIFRRIFSKYE
ncbi:DUF624 domain-containing protein [Caldibacillus lycopersici]|uniref:DUF624 domain-containing protein n=1 Tax=Perspicuibacillus lycopersici TaxID=1325689 RepID=A0AAE3LPR4_9BACI|nr:YesL family protein [Perspicuibacillus lycopersici]MCU9612579.1 DUF624 domain-containing protein [Perspicuibacillus lycopersici]